MMIPSFSNNRVIDDEGYFTLEELEEAVGLGNIGDISYDSHSRLKYRICLRLD